MLCNWLTYVAPSRVLFLRLHKALKARCCTICTCLSQKLLLRMRRLLLCRIAAASKLLLAALRLSAPLKQKCWYLFLPFFLLFLFSSSFGFYTSPLLPICLLVQLPACPASCLWACVPFVAECCKLVLLLPPATRIEAHAQTPSLAISMLTVQLLLLCHWTQQASVGWPRCYTAV